LGFPALTDTASVIVDVRAPGLTDRVAAALRAYLTGQRAMLAALSADLPPALDAIADYVLIAGKRVRPAFAYWGWRGMGRSDDPAIIAAAASLELLHACALMHDDVIDDSATRRGRPALHRLFAIRHERAQWNGDADNFGASVAILLGDLCLSWSFGMLRASGLTPEELARGAPVFDQMCTEVTAGQYLDVLAQARRATRVDTALEVVRLKTAKYTVERPLHLGGALAGADPALLAAYSGYGLPVGEAFQLRDDLLGVYGDPEVTGKPAGDDLREGKRTVLVALARQHATNAARDRMDRLIGDPGLTATGVTELRELIASSGAVSVVEQMISDRIAAGIAALDAAPIDPAAATALADLAVAAGQRHG
jgi:geranylgeranyl diphosphate synthase, type I